MDGRPPGTTRPAPSLLPSSDLWGEEVPREKEGRAQRMPLEDVDKTSKKEVEKRGFPLARQPLRRKVSTGESPPEDTVPLFLLPREKIPAEKTGKLLNIGRRKDSL